MDDETNPSGVPVDAAMDESRSSSTDQDGGDGGGDGGLRGEEGVEEGEVEGKEEVAEEGEGKEDEEIELPEEIVKSVEIIRHVSRETGLASTIYMVGTAHISKESCDLVEAVINLVKPKAVFIELCMERSALLNKPYEVPTGTSLLELWRSKQLNTFGVFYAYFLSKAAQKMEVLPGGEFRRAYETARALNALVVLGDRPVSITLKRAVGRLTAWQKMKLGWNLLLSLVHIPGAEDLDKMLSELLNTDELAKLLEEYCKDFPPFLEALLTERDLFMTATLRHTCGKFPSVVAVVGKGHVSGIISNWSKYPIEVDPLLEVPQKKSWRPGWKTYLFVGVGIGVYFGKRWMP